MNSSSLQKLAKNVSHNRWKNEFSQEEKIGRGGFASVYKAKNCFDENLYAVKKVKLRVKGLKSQIDEELERVINESKVLARFNHSNVLRYYNSWLEIATKPKIASKTRKTEEIIPDSILEELSERWTEEESQEMSTLDSINQSDSGFVFDRSSQNETSPVSQGIIFGESIKSASKEERRTWSNDKKTENIKKQVKDAKNKSSSTLEVFSHILPEDEVLDAIILFIQTELCTGTLGDYLAKRNEQLSSLRRKDSKVYQVAWKDYLKEALTFAKQILEGLNEIHSNEIIHRDLKPHNIFLADKVCKIGDFGLVKKNNSLWGNDVSFSSGKSDSCNTSLSDNNQTDSIPGNDGDILTPSSKPRFLPSATKSSEDIILYYETEGALSGGVGTKVYASPEQWEGNKEKFDSRVIFLLITYF